MTGPRWAALLLTSAVLLALAGAGGARADTGGSVTEFGWWTKTPGATTQAGGGFQVADAPGGPVSVAAIRLDITASSLSTAKLVLPEAQQVGTAVVQVCRTTSQWKAESPGMYANAPTPDCTSPVAMQRDATALVWTADVLPLLSGVTGEASLMVVPGPPPSPLPAPAPFQVSFHTAELQAEGSTSETPVVAPTDTSGGGFADTFGAGSSVGSPADFGVTAPLPGPAVPAPAPSEQVLTAPVQTQGRFPQQGDVGAPKHGANQPWGRLPLLVIGAAAIGAATSEGRRQLRARGLVAA
ncbi:MAG: hypothetical protein QOE35_1094 [Actinomycetota bacterium]|jgi:hypothetical protein